MARLRGDNPTEVWLEGRGGQVEQDDCYQQPTSHGEDGGSDDAHAGTIRGSRGASMGLLRTPHDAPVGHSVVGASSYRYSVRPIALPWDGWVPSVSSRFPDGGFVPQNARSYQNGSGPAEVHRCAAVQRSRPSPGDYPRVRGQNALVQPPLTLVRPRAAFAPHRQEGHLVDQEPTVAAVGIHHFLVVCVHHPVVVVQGTVQPGALVLYRVGALRT